MRTISKGEPLIKLGPSEAAALAMNFIGAKAFLGYPRFAVEMGLSAAWFVIFSGTLVSIAFWLVIASLLNRFPGKSLLEINEIVLGPLLGLGANLLGLLYIIISTSLLLREFSDAIIITALPDAPISAIAFLFIITMLAAAYFGLEPISRNTFISLPFILVGVTAVLFSLYSFWDFKQLFPVMGSGPLSILGYGFLNSTAFGEVTLLAILVPYFSFDTQKIKKVGLISIAVAGVYFMAITIVYIMVIPPPAAVENLTPFYQLSRTIYLGRYYQRLESVFIFFWTYTAFLRLAIGFILAALIARIALKLPYYRPLLPAFAVLFLSAALTPADFMSTVLIEKYRLMYGGLITLLLPSGISLLAVLLKKGGDRG